MTQVSGNPDVPGMGRRQFMNFLAFGAVTGTALGALYPVVRYFVPPQAGGPGAGTTAKDELGNDVVASDFLANHQPDERILVQGLKGDPTYLVVDNDQTLKNYGLNAVCTHLGCVVPWEAAQDKFICPCHGSQYDREGKVIRGPAPLSLALVDVDVNQDDKVVLRDWEDTDFRTGKEPWWTA
ncbi:cytochrome b6-f complex iron-sulfur subunit [Geitlerinema sp. PCC 9228]|jgi:cytochrome b6-f complex iron-sulfur subunit|uniref:cytochrome b6-f complex iron-sulfur subunit n=1 Tax=Geitlerinema sp. PCC 9228 TaxID=111611 RepID=UPI0008F9A184|nr:cytochrome b6-f complex iron-sulfur subunit [Geitlerinema sp. PCC 9228]